MFDRILALWQSLCLPVKVYIVLNLLSLALKLMDNTRKNTYQQKFWVLLGSLLWMVVWSWLIEKACQADHMWLAWILSIGAPVLVIVLVIIGVWWEMKQKKKPQPKPKPKK